MDFGIHNQSEIVLFALYFDHSFICMLLIGNKVLECAVWQYFETVAVPERLAGFQRSFNFTEREITNGGFIYD